MRTQFDPHIHGFAFTNSFTNHIAIAGIPITETRGRCGGMAYAALDYWHHRLPIPSPATIPVDGIPLADYVYARLIDSIVANWQRFYHFMRTPDHPTALNGIGVARATREEEFPKLRALLDSGIPQVLGLAQSRDVTDFGNDHQIVAYGYEFVGDETLISIYDNAAEQPAQTLRFSSTYDSSRCPVYQSNGIEWRGFFVETYAPQYPAFLQRGALVSDQSDPAIYVLHGGAKFWVRSSDEMDANGYSWSAVAELPDGSVNFIADLPGDHTVIRERTRPEVFVTYGGALFHIPSSDVLVALGFSWDEVQVLPAGALDHLRQTPVDGTVLKELSDPTVYVAEGGTLRRIPNSETFQACGYRWDRVGVVPDSALATLPRGADLPTNEVSSWAMEPGGQLQTRDNDVLSYRVEPHVVGDDSVEFVLELPDYLSWQKELVLVAQDGRWTITVHDNVKNDRNGLYRYQLPDGQLIFRKMKELGRMQDVFELGQLDTLPIGARVTFTWTRD